MLWDTCSPATLALRIVEDVGGTLSEGETENEFRSSPGLVYCVITKITIMITIKRGRA